MPPRFDPTDLHEIARLGVGLPDDEMFERVTIALEERYPGDIHRDSPWIFNNAGGAMGVLKLLHASFGEYLIFFGSPIGTEGHSGRYRAEVHDFMMKGEMWCYTDRDLERRIFRPGDAAYLGAGAAKGYRIPDHAFMLEYARGPILEMFPFGLGDSLTSTLDHRTIGRTIFTYGKMVTRSLIRSARGS